MNLGNVFMIIVYFSCIFDICATEFKIHEYTLPISGQKHILGVHLSRTDIILGIFSKEQGKLELNAVIKADSQTIESFPLFVKEFLDFIKNRYEITIDQACFGVPGPSCHTHDFVQSHHHSFAVDAHELIEQALFKKVLVLNDFELIGYGIFNADQYIQLNRGISQESGSKLVIGVGNGLGSCLVTNSGPLQLGCCYTEFIMQNSTEELEYIQFFQKHIGGNISWGKVLGSKGGIALAYAFVCAKNHCPKQMLTVREIIENRHKDSDCQQAITFFMKLYARFVRNAALMLMPGKGVFIANTLALEHPNLFDEMFIKEYFNCQHPVLQNMLEKTPLYLVTDPYVDLYGAAYLLIDNYL